MKGSMEVIPADKKKFSALPYLVGFQVVLTIMILGYVAYQRANPQIVEYPIVLVQQQQQDTYREKFAGKVTIFDLADLSEWHHYPEDTASDSASLAIQFLYPPNFDVSTDLEGAVHVSQNNTDFMVVKSSGTPTQSIPENSKYLEFSHNKKFYQFEDPGTPFQENKPIVYQGSINNTNMYVVDSQRFSPEVVYLMLMSMDYSN